MSKRTLAGIGSLVAVAGNVGWAVIIGDVRVGWPFWAIAVGTLAVGFAWVLPSERRRWPAAVGWLIAAAGGLWLLADQLRHGLGPDFPAEYLYYVGFLSAALTSFMPAARRWAPLGPALSAAGGLWWTALDVVHSSYAYTWANASLGIGYGLLALAYARDP